MNLNNQCCSWEQAVKLKKLGVRQISYFTFVEILLEEDHEDHKAGDYLPIIHRPNQGIYEQSGVDDIHYPDYIQDEYETGDEAAAFTSAELEVMLPYYTHSWDTGDISKCEDISECLDAEIKGEGKSLAQAKADRLIKLLETKTILIEAVNIRYSRW